MGFDLVAGTAGSTVPGHHDSNACHTKEERMTLTTEQQLAEQKRIAEKDRAAKNLPARTNGHAEIAVPDDRSAVQGFLDDVAPATVEGTMFDGKRGAFVTTGSDEQVIGDDVDFVAICDQTLAGWIRFNGEGQKPDKIMGLPYEGWRQPKRDTLGNTDPAQWELGLDGKPQDPWLAQILLPMQRCDNSELYVFGTTSVTGRRAVGNLLRTYERSRRTYPTDYPLVRCKIGGFKHKDPRVGMVKVPVLCVVGRTPKDGSMVPDSKIETDLNDNIPF
jgi:hypothetical protein